MKLGGLQENLPKGLTIVGHAVATRSTLPILSNVLLAVDQGLGIFGWLENSLPWHPLCDMSTAL